jgi:hypothetical protein
VVDFYNLICMFRYDLNLTCNVKTFTVAILNGFPSVADPGIYFTGDVNKIIK